MRRNRQCAANSSSERGFVIIAVLWILVALSALATIFSVYLSNSAQALAVTDVGLKTEALVSASLELTTYQLLLAGDKARPAQGSFRFRLDNADVLVSYTSEAARVDLNSAPKEMLANLFRGSWRGSKNRRRSGRADRRLADGSQGQRGQRGRGAVCRRGPQLLPPTITLCPCQRTQPCPGRAFSLGRSRLAVRHRSQRIAQRRRSHRRTRGDRRIAGHDASGAE